MYQIHIIDNLVKRTAEISNLECAKLCELIKTNLRLSNNGEYSNEQIEVLLSYKTPELIRNRVEHGFLVYFTNEQNDIIACGMITIYKNKYRAKMLQVRKDYQGLGLAKKICDIRENYLRKMGVKEVYNASLLFKKTLDFHKKRGFVEIGDKHELYTIMKKQL